MESLEVTYRVSGSEPEATERIESVLLEQTIETPRSVAERYPFVQQNMMGSIRDVTPDGDGAYFATLSLPLVTASVDCAQFLNVLFGNSSLHAEITLVDFTLPASGLELFRGPAFGVAGIRRLTGVTDRPLTCSALKPVGLDVEALTQLCLDFAEGGIDLVKDDHYLADQSFARFRERVRACQAAVNDVAARTGHRTIYVPNLSGTPDDVKRQAEFAMESGVGAVMMAPMLLGMPLFHEMCTRILDVPVLAHPSFGGSIAIRPETLFGKLFRLFGADAVIFANFGGRFSYPAEVCRSIAETLLDDWMSMQPSFPVPAGGMDADRAPELVRFFGQDVILLVGGSLLEAGDALQEKTRHFTESVHAAAALMSAT